MTTPAGQVVDGIKWVTGGTGVGFDHRLKPVECPESVEF